MNWIPREVIRADSLSLKQHQEAIAMNAIAALWRRRWLMAGIIALSLLLGLVYIQGLKSQFTSETIVQVDFTGDAPISSNGPQPGSTLDARSVIESDTRIIGSLSTARRVVSRLDLVGDPEFAQREGLIRRLLSAVGLGRPSLTPSQQSEFAALRLLQDLSVSNDRQSYLITIRYTSPDSDKAAQIANAFAAEYLQERSRVSFERANRSLLWLGAQITSAREALANIEQAIISESSTVDVRARQARLTNLEAEAVSIRERIRVLNDSLQQARALAELKPASARIAVQALPRTIPSSLSSTIILALIAAAGAVLGALLTFLLERLDVGFKTGTEVAPATDKPCLGELPDIRRAAAPLEKVIFSVAVRDAAIAGGLQASGRGSKIVVVTSALPGEGKSFFAESLAHSLTDSGHRVLTIDTSPCSMHDEASAAPSLEQVLGNVNVRTQLFAGNETDRFTHLSRYSSLIDGQEQFNFALFQDFLAQARGHYDVIIIEAPPVLLFIDQWLVESDLDSVILVTRWKKTPKKTVRMALRRLSDLSIHVKGVILSRVDLNQRKTYPSEDRPYFLKKYHRYYRKMTLT
jgi:polysaccharide biosynthesis transport protein